MPYVLLWLFLTTTGGVTSGNQEFPSKEACEAGRKQLGEMLIAVGEGHGEHRPYFLPPPEIRCIQKATGKP